MPGSAPLGGQNPGAGRRTDGAEARAPGLPPTHLLYLHGFRSSPQSFKAQRLRDWLVAHRPDITWACPQLPASPRAAIALCESIAAVWPRERRAVLGSSLGGFLATVLAERWDCPAVLLNPAVDPARDLAAYIGEQAAFHAPDDPHRRIHFRAEFVEELRAMAPPFVTRPQRYLAVIAKGDEVLDWREMRSRYPGAALRLLEGSDHALSDFDHHLPHVLHFLHLTP